MVSIISASLACCIDARAPVSGIDVSLSSTSGAPRLLSVALASGVAIWDCRSWAPLCTFKQKGLDKSSRRRVPLRATKDTVHFDGRVDPHDSLRSCRFSPSGEYLVACSDDHTLLVWSLRTGKVHAQLRGHKDVVYRCAFLQRRESRVRSVDGAPQLAVDADYVLYSASADGTVRAWDWLGGVPLDIAPIPHNSTVRDVDCLAMGFGMSDDITVGGASPFVAEGNESNDEEDSGGIGGEGSHDASSSALLAGAGGGGTLRVVSACIDGSALIWDAAQHCALGLIAPDPHWEARQRRHRIGASHDAKERAQMQRVAAVFGPGLPAANLDGAIGDATEAHRGPLNSVRFSPDGSLLATASSDGSVKIWDVVSFLRDLPVKRLGLRGALRGSLRCVQMRGERSALMLPCTLAGGR